MRKPTSVRELDPALALRDGRVDAWTVLVLWAIRKSWYALLLIGLTVSALLKGSPDDSGLVGWAEHHLVMLDGCLAVSVDGEKHNLGAGDSLRYQLYGPSRFETSADQPARYVLVLVQGARLHG